MELGSMDDDGAEVSGFPWMRFNEEPERTLLPPHFEGQIDRV